MKYLIPILFFFSLFQLFANDSTLYKGIEFCKQGKVDSALYYLNSISDEVTINTKLEDIFKKNYYIAKCYDKLDAIKSAEFYYLRAVKLMDSLGLNESKIYLDLSNLYKKKYDYVKSNEYQKLYYEDELSRLNKEASTSKNLVSMTDSLKTDIAKKDKEIEKLESDVRLLIILADVFGLAFFIAIIAIVKKKKTLVKKTKV